MRTVRFRERLPTQTALVPLFHQPPLIGAVLVVLTHATTASAGRQREQTGVCGTDT